MTIVKKRKASSSQADLQRALKQFIILLEGQKETEAAQDLQIALKYCQKGAKEDLTKALHIIEEAFGDEHELEAYTVASKDGGSGKWTEREALYLSSTSVLNLTKRIKKAL